MSQRFIDTFCELGVLSVLAFGILWVSSAILANTYSVDLLTVWGGR